MPISLPQNRRLSYEALSGISLYCGRCYDEEVCGQVPLAQQEKIWARQGVGWARPTMANWVIQCAQSWLKPLCKHMSGSFTRAIPVIHMDETVVQVLKGDNKACRLRIRMWLYGSGEYSRQHIRIFEYSLTGAANARELSERLWRMPDNGCYAGPQSGAKVTTAAAGPMPGENGAGGHAGRQLWLQQSRRRISVLLLFSLGKIHICRCQARKVPPECGLPLLEVFCIAEISPPEKGSKLEDAVRYSLNQKQQLMAFLDYGIIPISNNLAENMIQPFVVGRKIGCSATVSRRGIFVRSG